MAIWQAFVLGFVQGVAEFLPISSSGHLILLQKWFGMQTDTAVFYTIMLHVGTLVPVCVVLWKQIKGLFSDKWRRFLLLLLATVPAGIAGILFEKVIPLEEIIAEHYWILSIAFLFTAGEMIFSDIYSKKVSMTNAINAKSSFIMGCGQAIGVVSGISRSGSTITFGNFAKVDKNENANWTFIMSIPIILAAVGLQCLDLITGDTSVGAIDWIPLFIAVITAMLVGYLTIKFMLRIIKKANYKWFAVYLVIISVANFIVYFVK